MAILKNTQVAETPVEIPTSKGGIKLRPVGIDIGIPEELGKTGYGDSQYDSEMSKDNLDYLNEIRAQRQTLLDKVGNGLGNFASTVLTSAAENTIGTAVGITQALFEQDPSKLYNNDFAKEVLEPIQNWTKETMPFYYSQKEQDASVLGGMGYQNFWFDKALGGVGYTVGALASGYGLNKLLGVGKMATTGKLIENSADDVLKLASIESKVGSAIKLDVAKQIYVGMSMAHGESSQEARDSYEQALQSGMTESEAEAVANKNYTTNLFITGATNFALLNKFIKPSYQQAVERNLVHSVEKKGEDGIVKSFLEDATLKDKNRYIKGRAKKGLVSSFEEGSQELGQFMSNKLWQNYEDLANDENGKSAVDNFLTAFGDAATETFGSKEGLESALIGAITGAPFGMKGAKAEMLKLEENTAKYVNAMNSDPEFKNLVYRDAQSNIDTKLKLGNIVRAKAFFDQSEKALLEGDKFEYHNNQLNGLGQVVKIVADKGTFDVWRKSLLDFKSSDDIQAFNQRFGFSETEVKDVNDKNEKIDKILESVDDMYSQYNVTKEFFNMNKYDGISDPLLNNIVNQSLFDKLYFSSINLNNIEKREKEVAKELDKLGYFASEYNSLRTAANYNAERDEPLILQLLNDKELPNTADTYEKYRKKLIDTYRETYNKKLEELQKEQPHIAPLITEKLADLNKLAERRELFAKAYNQLISKEGRDAEVQALNNANEIAKKQTLANQQEATKRFEEEFGASSPVDKSKGPISLDNLSDAEADEVIALEKEWQTTTSATRLTEIVNRFKELGLPVISDEELQNSQNKVNAYLDKKRQEALDNNADVKDKTKFIGALNFKGIQPLLDDNDKVLLNNAINLLGNDFSKKVYLKISKAKHGTPGRKTSLGDNPLLQNNYNTVDVEVWVEGFDKPIGFIASYDRYATKEGDVIDVSLLTNEQIDQLFTLPSGETHDNFRAAYTDNKNFIFYVSKLLADNGDKEVTINNLDLRRIITHIGFTKGIFNPIPLSQDRTPLSQFQDRLLQVNGKPVIIDRYGKSINEDGIISKLTESNVLSFGDIILDDNLDVRPEFNQMMEQLSELNKKGELSNRYITLIANPAGPIIVNGQKYDVLPLSPQQLVEEDVDKLFDTLEQGLATVNAVLAENKNIDLQELDRLNESINKNIFIANTENSNVTIQITPSGLYKLKFAMSSKKTIIDIYVDPKDEMFLEDLDDLMNAFDRAFTEEAKTNTTLKELFKPLTVKSFKQVLPDKPNAIDPSDVINRLETPYTEVYKQKQTAILNFNAPKTVAPKVTPTQAVNDTVNDTVSDAVTNIERRRQEELDKLKENLENDLKEAEKEPDSAPKVKIRKADGSIDSNSIRQNAIEAANSSYEYGVRRINAKYDAELVALNKTTTPSSGGFGVAATNVSTLGNINPEDNSPSAPTVSPIDEELAEFGNGKKVTETSKDDELPAASLKANQVKDTIGWVEYSKAYSNLRAILGDTIGIEHMDKLATEIFDKNYLWGAFKDKTIYLNTSTAQGTEYHEAFHAIFRTFLNNYEIDNYLKVGKELLRNELKKSGISFEQHFTVFKNNPLNANLVKKLTDAELKDLVVEEFMADEFMKWKNKRENKSFLSKLFQSIADMFKLFTGRYESELDNFFYLIEGGKYVNHTVTKNKYYRDSIQAKLIPKDKRGGVTDPKRQMQMVNSIASKMLKKLYDNNEDVVQTDTWSEVFDEKLADEANQYNPDNYKNLSPQDKLFLAKEYFAHDGYGENEIGRAIIKEEVFKLLRAYNIDENAEVADLIEKEETNRTFSDLNNENRVASFGGLTNEIKKYIALTTYKVSLKEYFKNPNLPDTVIEVAVDPKKIYDGIIKNAADSLSDDEIIRSMIGFMGTSEECKIFITKFFDDIGIDVNEDGDYNFILDKDGKFKKPNLKQQVLKAFNLFTLDHRFVGYDIKKQQVLVQSANTQGVDTNQVNKWNRNFNDKFTNLDTSKKDIINTYDKLIAGLNPKKFTNSELEARITLLQNQFNNVSISLSRGYIKFMILSHGKPELLNIGQQNYVNTYVDRMETSNEFVAESLNQIKRLLQANNNPFGNQEVTEDENVERGEAIGRLKKFAKDNALHDEQVGVSNFKNAENNSVYAYQHGTFHVRQALELRRQSEKSLQNKINDVDKLANTPNNQQVKTKNLLDKFKLGNYLNNLTSFIEGVRSTLEIVRGEGMRVRTLASTDEGLKDIVKGAKEEGVTFGNFTTRDLLLYYYSMFTDRSKRTLKDGSKIAVSPVIINIMEASSTLDMVNLPVHDMYDANGLNARFIDVIYKEIEKEYNRIQLFDNNALQPNIDGYTTGEKPRAKIFWKWGNLLKTNLTEEQYQELESLRTSPEQLKQEIVDAINIYFTRELDTHLQLLVDEGIISSSVKEGEEVKYKNELLDKRFAKQKLKGMDPLFNEQDSLKTNIGKAFFSNYINVMSYNQLQLGDPALHGKDEIDWFKRARKLNAGGSSLYSTDFQNVDYAVIDDPKFTVYFNNGKLISEAEYDETNPNHSKDENKDKADAQAYGNEVLAEQMLRSLGRFTTPVENIFNKLKAGQEISFEERIKLKDINAMLNSYKLVGVDEYGQFLKMSVTFIFEKDVTYIDKNGNKQPITKHLERYHLYQAMKGIHMILPKSGSKNVTFGISKQQTDGSYSVIKNSMDTNFFRLQMENPAGKTEGKDPSQGIGINDTEQDDATKVVIDGKETTMGKVKEAYQKSKSDKSRALYHFHESFLFNVKNGVSTPKFDIWLNAVQESIASTGGNYQLTQLIELLKEKAFNIPAHYAQFEQYYNSHFSNVLQHKIPQYKTTLVSDFGYKVIEYEGKVITDKTYKADPEKWEALIVKGDATVRRLNHNVLGKDGRRYSEFMLPAHFAEFYNLKPGDEIPDEIAFMFGVRIPTQDKHSALALKLVDFLPAEQGSNAVFPEEIIVLTGSDFDIDAFYIHRPDHYVDDNGKIKLYGNTQDSEFSQYIRWNKDNNKLLKSLIKNLLKNAPLTSTKLKTLKKQTKLINLDTRITEDTKNSLLVDNKTEIESIENSLLDEALTMLDMPTTEEAYNKFKKDKVDLNIGKLNNDILNQKIAFQNNTYIAENIANTPTSLDLIDDELDNLAKLKGFENRKALDKSYDIFGFNGLSQAHASVSGGQMAIGSGVNYTQIYTFLNKYGIEILRNDGSPMPLIELNGVELYSYGKQLTEDNMRIMNVLSTLVSAMTDNGKHGYTSKSNINVNTLSVLCNIVMLGGNFRSGLYFINAPIIKKYSRLSQGNNIETIQEKKTSSTTIYDILYTEIQTNLNNLKYKPKEPIVFPFTDENLEFLIVNENNYGELSEEDKYKYNSLQLSILSAYANPRMSLSKFSSNTLQPISNILKLNKGLGTTHIEQDTVLEDLGKLKIKLVKSEKGNFKILHKGKPSSLDIKTALEKHLITSVNLVHTVKILEHAKEVQLSRADYFIDTWKAVKENISKFLTNRKFTYAKIEKDLMSYLVIKAWRKNLANDSIVYDPMALLYSPMLKNMYNEFMKDAEFNENSFINIIKMQPVDENGFFEIKSNSFTNENKEFEERLINGYAALYNNPKYKEFATNMYLYLGAKDAFQFKSGTFINYISPALFKRLGNVAEQVRVLIKDDIAYKVTDKSENYQTYLDLFDVTPLKLQKDFLSLYLRDINNAYDLNFYGAKKLMNNGKSVIFSGDSVTLDLYGGTTYIHENELITITQDTDIEEELSNIEEAKENKEKQLVENIKVFSKLKFNEIVTPSGIKYIFPLVFTRSEEIDFVESKLIYELVSVNNRKDLRAINAGTKAVYKKSSFLGNRSKQNIVGMSLEEAILKENKIEWQKKLNTYEGNNKVVGVMSDDFELDYNDELDDIPFEDIPGNPNIGIVKTNINLNDALTLPDTKTQEVSKENLDKKDEEKGKELTEKCKTGSSGGFGVSNINNIKDIID